MSPGGFTFRAWCVAAIGVILVVAGVATLFTSSIAPGNEPQMRDSYGSHSSILGGISAMTIGVALLYASRAMAFGVSEVYVERMWLCAKYSYGPVTLERRWHLEEASCTQYRETGEHPAVKRASVALLLSGDRSSQLLEGRSCEEIRQAGSQIQNWIQQFNEAQDLSAKMHRNINRIMPRSNITLDSSGGTITVVSDVIHPSKVAGGEYKIGVGLGIFLPIVASSVLLASETLGLLHVDWNTTTSVDGIVLCTFCIIARLVLICQIVLGLCIGYLLRRRAINESRICYSLVIDDNYIYFNKTESTTPGLKWKRDRIVDVNCKVLTWYSDEETGREPLPCRMVLELVAHDGERGAFCHCRPPDDMLYLLNFMRSVFELPRSPYRSTGVADVKQQYSS